MSTTDFSVILITDDESTCLERAICSVRDQAVGGVQLIVVRHGRADADLPTLAFYHDEIDALVHAPGVNQPTAFNRGIELATGRHLLFLTADDVMLPDTLAHLTDALANRPAAAWRIGASLQLGADERVLACTRAVAPGSAAAFLRHDAGHLPLAGSVLRRDLFDRFGLFDPHCDVGFDYEFACRLLVAGVEPRIDPTTLVAQRVPEQLTAETVIRHGLAIIGAARRHARALSLADRLQVWRNCDLRQRIYALARAELHGRHGRHLLWHELIRHPWWAFNERLRQVLLHGLPVTASMKRHAA